MAARLCPLLLVLFSLVSFSACDSSFAITSPSSSVVYRRSVLFAVDVPPASARKSGTSPWLQFQTTSEASETLPSDLPATFRVDLAMESASASHVEFTWSTGVSLSSLSVVSSSSVEELPSQGTFVVTLSYTDTSDLVQRVTLDSLVIDALTIPPRLVLPASDAIYTDVLPIDFEVPEQPRPGTVCMSLVTMDGRASQREWPHASGEQPEDGAVQVCSSDSFADDGYALEAVGPVVYNLCFNDTWGMDRVQVNISLTSGRVSDAPFVTSFVNHETGEEPDPSMLLDGVYRFRLTYEDVRNNSVSEVAESQSVRIDTLSVPPTLVSPEAGSLNHKDVKIRWTMNLRELLDGATALIAIVPQEVGAERADPLQHPSVVLELDPQYTTGEVVWDVTSGQLPDVENTDVLKDAYAVSSDGTKSRQGVTLPEGPYEFQLRFSDGAGNMPTCRLVSSARIDYSALPPHILSPAANSVQGMPLKFSLLLNEAPYAGSVWLKVYDLRQSTQAAVMNIHIRDSLIHAGTPLEVEWDVRKAPDQSWVQATQGVHTLEESTFRFSLVYSDAGSRKSASGDVDHVRVDFSTLTPTLALSANQVLVPPVSIPYVIPEAPRVGSVQLRFIEPATSTVLANVSLPDLFGPDENTLELPQGSQPSDGVYDMELRYRDFAGNTYASAFASHITIDRAILRALRVTLRLYDLPVGTDAELTAIRQFLEEAARLLREPPLRIKFSHETLSTSGGSTITFLVYSERAANITLSNVTQPLSAEEVYSELVALLSTDELREREGWWSVDPSSISKQEVCENAHYEIVECSSEPNNGNNTTDPGHPSTSDSGSASSEMLWVLLATSVFAVGAVGVVIYQHVDRKRAKGLGEQELLPTHGRDDLEGDTYRLDDEEYTGDESYDEDEEYMDEDYVTGELDELEDLDDLDDFQGSDGGISTDGSYDEDDEFGDGDIELP